MMGYRDPTDLEWEADFWDDYVREFGATAYVEERYVRQVLHAEKRDRRL